jgi:multidrug efflux system outer membrane protein
MHKERVLSRFAGLVGLLLTLAVPAAAQVQPQAPVAAPTPAAQGPMMTVEFDEAIRQALEKNPTLGQAAVSINRAQAMLDQVKAITWPSLSLGYTHSVLDASRAFSGGTTQPQNQSTVVVSARYNTAGWAGLNQARDNVVVATASSAEARQGVAVAAADAYLAVIASRRQIEVATQALEASRAHLTYADRRLEGGAGSRLNQLRAAQEVTTEELRLETARLALLRSQEALGVILVAEAPVDAGAEPAFVVPPSIDESSLTAVRPDLLTQTAIQRAAERVVRESWYDWLPFPTLAFEPSAVRPIGLFQPSKTWRFSVSLTQPIFDGGGRRAVKRDREQALESARLTFSETATRARSEVRVARDSLDSLNRALALARAGSEQAADVLRITTTAFEVGATTNIEVIDAQRSARHADSAVVIAEDAVRRARLDLLVALGRFPTR